MFMERVGRRAVCGHIEHPSDGLPDLRKYATVLTDVGYVDKFPGMRETLIAEGEDPETAIIGEFEALPTPDGKIVEALWEAEVETGASSRAQGSVVRNEGAKYPQYPTDADIVQDDVDEDTIVWDIVARPSTPGAFPRRVLEAISEAQAAYHQEQKAKEAANRRYAPPGPTGDMVMDLTEIRTRLSRLVPKLEGLSVQPRVNLTGYLKELTVLTEGLERAARSATESQDKDLAATMKGEVQHHRDQVMQVIEAALDEAEPGKLPGAKGLSVPKSPSVDELDVLPTVGKKGQNLGPGGAEGQGHIEDPDGTANDGTPPGPGVKPGVKVPAGPTGQTHGKIIGQESQDGDEASLEEEGAKQPKKIPGAKGTKVAYQDKNPQTSRKPKKGPMGLQGIVASEEPDGDEEVVQETGDDENHYEEIGDMDIESLADLNTGLVNENRGLRRDNQHLRKQFKAATNLAITTGKRYREEQFKTVMERLIETNPVLDNAQCRAALETASDVKHMISLAEAMLGARVRMHNEESVNLDIKLEEDGFYRLVVNGEEHHQIFDGPKLYQTLQKMGVEEGEIEASFAKAHGIDYEKAQGISEMDDEEEIGAAVGDDLGAGDDFDFGDDDDELDLGDMGDEEPVEGGEKFEAPPEVADVPDAEAFMLVPMQPAAESKKPVGGFQTMMERLNRASGGSRETLTEGQPGKPGASAPPQRKPVEEAILPVGVRRSPKKPPKMADPEKTPLKGDGSALVEAVIARKKRDS